MSAPEEVPKSPKEMVERRSILKVLTPVTLEDYINDKPQENSVIEVSFQHLYKQETQDRENESTEDEIVEEIPHFKDIESQSDILQLIVKSRNMAKKLDSRIKEGERRTEQAKSAVSGEFAKLGKMGLIVNKKF